MAARTVALGKRIDKYFEVRAKRLKLERDAGKLKESESLIKDELIDKMNQAKLDSAKGTMGSVSITTPTVAQADDWTTIFAWIKKTGTFEVLSPRLHNGNIAEQLEHDPKLAKRGIPGVNMVKVTKFTATAKRGT